MFVFETLLLIFGMSISNAELFIVRDHGPEIDKRGMQNGRLNSCVKFSAGFGEKKFANTSKEIFYRK